MRHSYEIGGFIFSLCMAWAQAFPFAVVQLYDDESDNDADYRIQSVNDMKEDISLYLFSSLIAWLILNLMFFCSIDLNYLSTFFSTQTGPQYICDLYTNSEEDSIKFKNAFRRRLSCTKAIHDDVNEWVEENIRDWIAENEEVSRCVEA